MDNLNYEPKMIVRHIEQTYQYTISYLKAWRAKQKVFEMRFGTYEALKVIGWRALAKEGEGVN